MLSHETLCDPMDCSPPVSSVCGIWQASILEWLAVSFSRGSFWPRDRIRVSCLANQFFTTKPPGKPVYKWKKKKFEHTRMLLIQRICATLSCTWNTFLQNIGGWVIHAPSSNLCLKTTSMRHMATICKTVTPTVATYPHSVLFHQHLTPPNILCNLTIYHWCIYDLFFFARVKPPSKQRICQFFFFPSCITSSWHIVHIRQKSDEREKGMNEKSGKY